MKGKKLNGGTVEEVKGNGDGKEKITGQIPKEKVNTRPADEQS